MTVDDSDTPWHPQFDEFQFFSECFSSVGAWCIRPALSIVWHKLLEGYLVALFVVLPNFQEDESMHRETLENLGRSPSAEKHMHMVLAVKGQVRTLKRKLSVSWR